MSNIRCLSCMELYDESQPVCPHCGCSANRLQIDPMMLPIGTVLEGRYIIGKALGNSEFIITYLAWDKSADRKIVIKEYFPKNLSTRAPGTSNLSVYDGEKSLKFEEGLRAYLDEGKMLSSLARNVSGVVKCLGVFIDNSTAYMAMEYVDGISLDKVISRGRLPWKDVLEIMHPFIQSMRAVHEAGYFNCIIAPDNIILTREREIKVSSFGLSRLKLSDTIKNYDIIVKKGFSAEEMYHNGIEPDGLADVYSIAAVMYYAITGIVPQPSIERLANDRLKRPSELGIKMPVNKENALMNALNVDKKFRTTSCAQLESDLYQRGGVQRIVEEKDKVENGKISSKMKVFIIIFVCIGALLITATAITMGSHNLKGATNVVVENHLMPDFKGKSFYDAYRAMEAEGWICRVKGRVSIEDYSDDYQADDIVAQSIPDGTDLSRYNKNDRVLELTVVSYDEDAEINDDCGKYGLALTPNIQGMNESEAVKVLKKYGFEVNVDTRNDDANVGKVLSQSIGVKDEPVDLKRDNKITIVVATKTPTTTAPPTTAPATTKPRTSPSSGKSTTKAPTPPTTKAPTTNPPTTRPPATKPPTTKPPTTQPPTTKPPTTKPPTTQPPTTKPPTTQSEKLGGVIT